MPQPTVRRLRTLISAAALAAAAFAPPFAAAPASAQGALPQTGAEQANFERATAHDELLAYLYDVQTLTDRMRIVELARTDQGRAMPLVLLGAPPPASAAAARFSGRPTLLITGNVHGGERAGREGSLQLIRELTVGSARMLLEHVNVLVVPTLNPDGAENGTRTNSLGYDMNRDFIVAETPEIAAVLALLTDWWPDVYVDVHNGGAYPYHVTYQATLHPVADAALVAFARGPMYDGVARHLGTQDMRMYWYSGPRRGQDGEWSWRTTEPWARKQHTYGGLQNMVTLLFEIPGRWTLREQADNAREGLIGLISFVATNAAAVRSTVAGARQRTLAAPPVHIVTRVAESAYPQQEQFYVMDDGEPALVTGTNRTLYIAEATRAWPWAYAFDGRLNDVAAFLRRHAIAVERLDTAIDASVEMYRLDSLAWSDAPYQNHLMAAASVTTVSARATLPAGMYLVRMSQNAARVIAELMEPDTEDSLVAWNFLDHSLPAGRSLAQRRTPFVLPIYRVVAPAAVRATLVR